MKKCGSCKQIRDYSCYYKSKSSFDGFQNRCKSCSKQNAKEWRLKNQEKIKSYKINWEKNNIEHCKNYRIKNKESIRLNTSNWYIKNKDLKLKREKERLSNDLLFKLKHNIRRNIKQSLYKMGYSKQSKTQNVLGCDYDYFYKWLNISEKGLDMHIDHIVPISLAVDENEINILNHYSNLQLLNPIENLKKGNSYIKKENLNKVIQSHPQPNLIKQIVDRSDIEIID